MLTFNAGDFAAPGKHFAVVIPGRVRVATLSN